MRIAVLDDYHDISGALAGWGDLAPQVTVFRDTVGGEDLVARLAPFDVVCLMRERTPFPAGLIAALPRLRLIITSGMRNLAIDMEAATARGITVCGTSLGGAPTPQLTAALVLAAMRGLMVEHASMRNGGWQAAVGRDLTGLTLGLVGLGKIGAAVTELLRPFGMEFIAWSRNLTDERCAEVGGVTRMPSLDSLLERADAASIHLVLSERTRGLIGAAELSRMKPDALLVNTSRGPIVDENALLDALRAGRPGMAALDVYAQEPLPADHPLRDRDLIDTGRLLLTPHIGYGTRQSYGRMYHETAEAVRAWAAGAPVQVLAGA